MALTTRAELSRPLAMAAEAPLSPELLSYYRDRVAGSEAEILELRSRVDAIELSQARRARRRPPCS